MSATRSPAQQALFEASGAVTLKSRLAGFLYLLMRDHLPTGVVGALLKNIGDDDSTYTNGWLARYAEHVANGLTEAAPDRLELWAHLVSEHATILGTHLSYAELMDLHDHEHAGPGTIRNHPRESLHYTPRRLASVMSEAED